MQLFITNHDAARDDIIKWMGRREVPLLTVDRQERTIKVGYRTSSPETDNIHANLIQIKEVGNRVEESEAHVHQQGAAALTRTEN